MKETNVPWSVGEALLALMIISVLSFLVGSLVLPFLTDTGTQFLLAGTLQTVFIFVVLYYYLNLKHRVTFQNIGFRTRPFFSTILRAMSWGIGIFLVVIVSGTVIDHFLPGQPQLQPFAKLVLEADNGWDLLLPLFLAVIVAPLGEEAFFRGFLYPALKQKIGLLPGVIVAGSIFGLMHFDIVRFLPLALGGMGLIWLYEKAETIYAPILAHGLWNGVMVMMLFATANSA